MVQTMIGHKSVQFKISILPICLLHVAVFDHTRCGVFLFYLPLQVLCSYIMFDSSRSNIHSAKATNSVPYLCTYDV